MGGIDCNEDRGDTAGKWMLNILYKQQTYVIICLDIY